MKAGMKGQAALAKVQNESNKTQLNAANEQMKRMIDKFEAITDRMDTQISAEEAGAKIDNTRMDTFGKQIDNAAKSKQLQLANASADDLFKQIAAG